MQNADRILNHEQIRNRVWAFDSESASNIVAAQIRLLRKKLNELGDDGSLCYLVELKLFVGLVIDLGSVVIIHSQRQFIITSHHSYCLIVIDRWETFR